MRYHGSCHCGNVAFDVEGELGPVVECNCSYRSRRGTLLWFVPRSAFELATPGASLSSYRFNKHVFDHRFCPTCGCAPFSLGRDQKGREIAAINVRCLENVELDALQRIAFDGRSL